MTVGGETQLLMNVGKIAGIGGIAVCLAFFIFRDTIRGLLKNKLGEQNAYQLLRLIVIFSFVTGIAGLGTYLATNLSAHPTAPAVPPKPLQRPLLYSNTGWIYAGVIEPQTGKFTSDKDVDYDGDNACDKSRIGSTVTVTKDRHVVVIGYGVTHWDGWATPPTSVHYRDGQNKGDWTDIVVPKDYTMTIRDVDLGGYSGDKPVCWLRIADPPDAK